MTIYELLSVGIAVGNRVDIQWGLIITVHLALFGGIIYVNRPLRLPEKIGAVIIYLPFAILNYRIMRVQMNLMQNAYQEVARKASEGCCRDNYLVEFIVGDVASGRFTTADLVLTFGHITMAVLVLASIAFDKEIGQKSSP